MGTGLGGVRVLHVDDEPAFAETAAEFIERAEPGFTVETTTDSGEVLERLETGVFDCLVVDYEMPGRDGIELLEAVREDYPALPVILYTGKGSEEVASEAISAGVTDYLQKSGSTEQYEILANRIRNAVEAHRAQQAIEESERELRQVYERITDGFFAVNADWEYVYANEEGARLTDRTVDELIGTTVWEAFPELAGSPFEAALRESMAEQGTRKVEDYYPPLDSWFEVRIYGAEEGISIYFRDVTDRREREAERQLMEQIVQSMNDAAVLAQDGLIKYTNPQVTELVGYPAEELRDEPMLQFIAPEHRETVEARHRARLADDGDRPPELYEIAVESETGERIPVEINVAPIEYQGRPATLSLVRDISDRKRREERLERLIEEYETVFETAQDAIFLFDVERVNDGYEFRLRRLNPAHEAISGLSTEADRGKTPREFLGEETGAEVAENYRRCVEARESIEYEEVLEMPAGPIHWRTKLSPVIEDDQVTQIVGVARDITERVAERRELEVAKRQLTAILENTTTPIFMKDDEGRYIFANSGYGDVFGIDDEELAGRTDRELFPPEMAAVVEANDRAVLERGEVIEVEETIDTGDGERTYRTTKVPIYDTGYRSDEDEPVAVFGVASDITDLKQRERALERERDRLEAFASVVSHDLRNPLSVASGRLELAREDRDDENLQAVARAHDRMESLIDDLLALAREGKAVDDPEPVDLAAVAEESWKDAESGDASLDVSGQQRILADETRFRQVFENLFRNAVEHGGDDVSVRVGTFDGGFYVEDDGPGIPDGRQEDVFRAGYTSSEKGAGFGLAIVKEIAEAHGWEVTVDSGSDGGARFEFTGVDSPE